MTLFDVPSHDVLFTHIFSNLRLIDIWNLRLVSRELHCLCWDYFINVCDTLSVTSQITHSSSLCVAAGINILSKCEKVRCLEVICGDQEVSTFFGKLLREVIRNENIVLKRVCFIGIDFTSITSELMDSFAIKCCKLREFKLRGILVREIPAEDIIAKLIKHCKQNLLKLSIMNLISPLIRPLSRETLPSLKCLSITNCSQISSEGCLEELFRKCPMLEVVDLRQTKSVTNRTLLVLTEYCSRLQQLLVKGCTLITMALLVKIHCERGVNIDIELLDIDAGTKIPGQI